MASNVNRKAVWLPAEVWALIEKYRKKDEHQSISQFIDAAVRYYCCSFETENHKEILTKEITQAIRSNIKNSENHIGVSWLDAADDKTL